MTPSENAAGAETTIDEQPTGIEHLGQLLSEDDSGETPETDAGASQSGEESGSEKPKPKQFNDLAGMLEMELDDLYKLEVSQAEDGTPVTIENLKDHYAKQVDFSLREVEFEERKSQQESDLMQAQQEIRDIMAALPEKAVKPEVLEKVRARHEAQMQLERKRTLDVIKEWQDDKVRETDLAGMSEHLKQYGYPVDHLERVADHRQLKYIRDNWLREQRIRKALEAVKAGKPNPTTRQKPSSKAPLKNALAGVKRGNARNKLEAVFSELD